MKLPRLATPTSALGALALALFRMRLRAIESSPSLVHLLYLPAPDDPVSAFRPRSAPTALRSFDLQALGRGETVIRGRLVPLEPPLPWLASEADSETAHLHAGEEVLALVRLARKLRRLEPAARACRIALDWIAHNPVGSMPGFEPALVARRLACWCTAITEWPSEIEPAVLRPWLSSIHVQARFLASNLERHEGGLKLLSELRALLGAGALLTGAEPRRWSDLAARLLVHEVRRQVNPDGGHVSRSPGGHLRALADLVDAAELLPPEAPAARAVRECLPSMARFARALAHPDGGPVGFAGTTRDRAPELASVLEGGRLVVPPLALAATFPDTGYTSFQEAETGDALVVDWLGPPPQALEPGAAGNFEAAFEGERFVVTPLLTSAATLSRAHNSVAWARGSGAVQPRTHLDDAVWGEGPGFEYLGLDLKAGRTRHARKFLVLASRAVIVVDRISNVESPAEVLLQLEHGVHIQEAGERRLYLEKRELTVTLAWAPGMDIAAAEGTVSGPLGEPREAPVLRLRAARARAGDRQSAGAPGDQHAGLLLAFGRRRDAGIELHATPEDRVAVRFDPRRYLVRWEPGKPPRLLLAD